MTSYSEESQRPMNTWIDLEVIKKIARKDLIASLQKFPGNKALVWDRALTNSINLVVSHSDFKEHGVTKMLSLEQKNLYLADIAENIIFICRPIVTLMQFIKSAIENESSAAHRKSKYHLLFVPSTNLLCQKWLENQGMLNLISTIEELPLFLFPLDTDVLTMEMDGVLKAFHGENDPSSLYYVAKALVFLQRKYGTPSKIFGKGQAAQNVHELMEAIKHETGPIKHQICGSKISNLILIDRQIDLLSPLVTQLTYEGLIDEFYGINGNQVKLPIVTESFDESKTLLLSSSEDLYGQLRNRNFSAVGALLREKTMEVQEVFKQKNKAQNVGEMKKLVQQLHSVNALKQSLTNHTSVAELLKANTEKDEFLSSLECEQELLNGVDVDKINAHIENLCVKKAPLTRVLRLFLIQSITSGGLRPKVMQHYERLIIQNYGFKHILTLEALHQAGFICAQGGTGRYAVLRRALTLTVCDGSETHPEDFAYVHSIYAPLSIRLIQHRLKPTLWATLKDSLNSLMPGPTVDEHVPGGSSDFHDNKLPNTSVIVFIGGCTFAEISALRFLAKQEDEHEFLVVTTKMINGNTLMNEFMPTADELEAF